MSHRDPFTPGPNALDPDAMSDGERLDEVARLLALAILRRRKRRENSPDASEKALDFRAELSPDVPVRKVKMGGTT